MKFKHILPLMLFVLFTNPALSALSSKGTEFWAAMPPEETMYFSGNYIYITSEFNVTGNVSISGISFSQNFQVSANSVTLVVLPLNCQLTEDVVESKGIHITSSSAVSVYVVHYVGAGTDGFTAMPVESLGNDYEVMTYTGNIPQFAIVVTEDFTSITFTATASITTKLAGTAYNIILNRGETYLYGDTILVLTAGRDLTGSVITSDKPIAVIATNVRAFIPVTNLWANNIIEQLPPTISWGKEFLSMPFSGRTNGDTFRFLAKDNNTVISINGSVVSTINKGQFYEQVITSPSKITSSNAVLAAQFANSGNFDGAIYGDPSMMILAPTKQFMNGYVVDTPSINFPVNFLNVIVPDASRGSVLLDSANIPFAQYTPIASSGYSGCRIPVNQGAHVLTGPEDFGVYVYGFDSWDAYSYPGGCRFDHIDGTPTITQTVTTTATYTNTATITQTYTVTQTHTITPTFTVTLTYTQTPVSLVLEAKGNFPNPFKEYTNIVYQLSRPANIGIKIFTVSGEVVLNKTDIRGLSGYNTYIWDGRNKNGNTVASGVYIYMITAETDRNEKVKQINKCAIAK